MFLPVLFALDLQNEIQPLSTFFGILGWLVYWVVIEKCKAFRTICIGHTCLEMLVIIIIIVIVIIIIIIIIIIFLTETYKKDFK